MLQEVVQHKVGNGGRANTPGAGGGAGPIGGFKAIKSGVSNGDNGDNGTGGLLIIYAKELINKGKIEANGKNGGTATRAPGGSSGGGSINLFYSKSLQQGITEVNGGKAVMNSHSSDTYLITGRSRGKWNSNS